MRRLLPFSVGIILMVIGLAACSPVYIFRLAPGGESHLENEPLRSRLHSLLNTQGFQKLGLSDRATGDIGCGRSAPDRTTYEKEWRDTGLFRAYYWMVVHEFSCEGAWYIVIVSSVDAEAEAAELRDAVSEEFAQEIASGKLDVKRWYRLPLE